MTQAIELIRDEIRQREAGIETLTRERDGLQIALDVLTGVTGKPVIEAVEKPAAIAAPDPEPDPEPVTASKPKSKPAPETSPRKSPQVAVMDVLEEAGARQGWVKLTYAELAERTGLTQPSISSALQDLPAVTGLRVHKVTRGALRGNHFTFSSLPWPDELTEPEVQSEPASDPQPDPDPEPDPETAADPEPEPDGGDETDLADAALGYLLGVKERSGMSQFQLKRQRVLDALGCTRDNLFLALDELQTEGELTYSLPPNGDLVFRMKEGV